MEKEKYNQLDKRLLADYVSATDKNNCAQNDSKANQRSCKKILVAGDIMLDTYCFGNVKRISPEAPVPVLHQKESAIRHVAGGAANVAVNLVAAGTEVDLFSVIGNDQNGEILINCLKKNDIGVKYITCDSERVTTSKLRYIGQNNQQLFRVDSEICEEVCIESVAEQLILLEQSIDDYELFLLSDYMKGFLSEEITQELIRLAKKAGIQVLVDVKDTHYTKYRDATLIKPNRKELGRLTGLNVITEEQIVTASVWLCKELKSQFVLTTLGADGMILTDANGLVKKVSSIAKEVYDVTGAGDTSIAYLAAELAKGKDIIDAMEIANYAAGIKVSKMGTSIVYPDEVENALKLHDGSLRHKQLNMYQKDGLKAISEAHQFGRKIVFTNGCFDILHSGHIVYLQHAKEMGDLLVIGVNSDASIKRLKGEDRPVNSLADRLMLLSAISVVDYVIPFEEDTPQKLIEAVIPDVLVKGGDYTLDGIVGADFVKARGGVVTTIPFVEGKSTTNIISKIRK